jgi:hypothetical protein
MATGDLTDLPTVKAWLGIPSGSTEDDALLTGLITAASQFIQTWLNRQLMQATYTEVRDGTGGQRLVFMNYPVTSVASLTVGMLTVNPVSNPSTGTYPNAGYLFTPTEIRLNDLYFERGFGNVQVTYTAGYATVPPDVQQAATELVSLRYRERDRIGHASKAVGGETVSYTIVDMSPDIKTLLSAWRRVVML